MREHLDRDVRHASVWTSTWRDSEEREKLRGSQGFTLWLSWTKIIKLDRPLSLFKRFIWEFIRGLYFLIYLIYANPSYIIFGVSCVSQHTESCVAPPTRRSYVKSWLARQSKKIVWASARTSKSRVLSHLYVKVPLYLYLTMRAADE